ncbi:MAG: helix-turn-helix domain-containing protein [Methylococcales bacterium]|nr:helix-turn-helix domain-containing protein [Methylococcales bacterium]
MSKEAKKKNLSPGMVCSNCPEKAVAVRELMTRIGDKWSVFLIVVLSKATNRRARFSDLEKTIPGISPRMLTVTLKNLERDGLVLRELFPEIPPRVEYELTKLGESLLIPMQGLVDWVGNHWDDVEMAREKYDGK